MLRQLHSDRVAQFAATPGFGVARMRYLPLYSPDRFAAPAAEEIELPFEIGQKPSTTRVTFNTQSAVMFLDAERTGYAESIDQVVGFASHAFTRKLGDSSHGRDAADEGRPAWRLDRLELISLLLHDEPVAYVSDKLPNMEELRGAPTRPLDEFEAAALAKLRGASDLEVHEEEGPEGKRVRMVGALRVGADCGVCHDAPRGALLGAFSYDLTELAAKPSRRSPPSGDR